VNGRTSRGAVGAAPYPGAVLDVAPETSLVRRARKVNRVLADTYPDARCELDFDDPFHFSRVFKKLQGASPAAFQQLHRRAAG